MTVIDSAVIDTAVTASLSSLLLFLLVMGSGLLYST